jgi:hypothetical protein
MKQEMTHPKLEVEKIADGLFRAKVREGRGFFKIGIEKRPEEANALFLEINGRRKFEVGNDCDTCHFWFKLLDDPKLSTQKKIANLPKSFQTPRPLEESLIHELSPLLELMEKGDYDAFDMTLPLSGPYSGEDEGSYFFNNEFLEIWGIENPKEEGILPGWNFYEGARPRVFRHPESNLLEKQFDFIVPLVERESLNEEYIKIYQEMIIGGDRPRILLLGLYQRPIPESVQKGRATTFHSFFSGFVLDGHHKLAAYRRAGVSARFLTILSQKASKYFLLPEEGTSVKKKFEERLATLAH